jgi:hypothetical protein
MDDDEDLTAAKIAMRAMTGDRDEPRTLFSWLLALNGREQTLQALVTAVAAVGGTADSAHWIAIARICDGLDISEIVGKVEEAFDALGLVEEAIQRTLDDWIVAEEAE